MLQCHRQLHQRRQTLDGQPVTLPGRPPVGPGGWQRHPPSRASFANQYPLSSRPTPFKDDREAFTDKWMKRMGDDNRFRNRARLEEPGAMRAPSAHPTP
jgi:hypothetical protein